MIAEYATGHVFKKDLTVFLTGDDENEAFQVFDNVNAAKAFVLNFIKKRPEFECSISDHKGKHIATFDVTGERIYDNDA